MSKFVFIECSINALFSGSSERILIHNINIATGRFMTECRLMAATYAPVVPNSEFWLIPTSAFYADVQDIMHMTQAQLRELVSSAVVSDNGLMFNKKSLMFGRIPH